MRIRPSSYVLITIMIIALVIIILSLGFPRFQDKLLPMIFSGLVFVLAAIELGRELRAKAEPSRVKKGGEAALLRRHFYHGAWVIGLFLAIYLVGFKISTPLFIAGYLRSEKIGWFTTIGIAVLTTMIIWGAFEVLLKLDLYKGLLFGAR